MSDSLISSPVAEIARAYADGDLDRGNALFDRAGGDMFVFRHGYDALGVVLDAMPEGHWRIHESALCALVFYLAKHGRAARAHVHLCDPTLTFARTARFTIAELLTAIHLGDPIRSDDLERWILLERRLPVFDPLVEGLYYNAMLVVLVRVGRLTEARSMGLRSITAFRAADHCYLEHFIHLHLTDLSIMEGHLRQGRRHLQMARSAVERWGVTYGNEAALAEVVALTLDYEQGRIAHIPARSRVLREALVSGDSWAEIFNQLGRIMVLSLYFSSGRDAALAELELFRAGYAERHGRHSDVLALLEIEVDRLDSSLGNAGPALAQLERQNLRGPIGTMLLGGLEAALGRPDEPGAAAPPGPRAALDAGLRQAARATPQVRRKLVEEALWLAVREGHVAPFVENREVMSGLDGRLASGRFARGHVQLARMARHVMRAVEDSYHIPPALRARGVTYRQFRVMTALQSGGSNKTIARTLGLSEAGIKYHLANLYRLTGTRRRGQLQEIITSILEKPENYPSRS